MPLTLDPEFEVAVAAFFETLPDVPKHDAEDYETRRKIGAHLSEVFKDVIPKSDDVDVTKYATPASDGHLIPIYRFVKQAADTGMCPAILHIHGGGMITGDVLSAERSIAKQVSVVGVQTFSVDYRLAPEHRHPILIEDCYTALLWLHENAKSLGIDARRIAVMGESAGGGIAAGLALLARDRALQPPLAKQILIYPMLDDRNVIPNYQLEKYALWKAADNAAGWKALLGDAYKTNEVSPYAAPARATDLANLPSTYLDTGGLDLFRDEDIAYAARIVQANVPVELHVYPGVPHGFEGISETIGVTRRALENRRVAMTSF